MKNDQKKKTLLLFPQIGIESFKPQSPLSLLSLCPNLEQAGYCPIIIDARMEPDYKEKIKEILPQVLFVGITSMTGLQIKSALLLAMYVRQLSPPTKIIWGGIHVSLLPRKSIENPLVDIVVEGEGEETIVDLARCLDAHGDLSSIKGIYFRDSEKKVVYTGKRPLMDMKKCLIPSWHLVDVARYSEIGVQAGRGCPWGCTFCYNHKYNERRWRGKDAKQVIDELKLLKNKYGISMVTFYDDNFFSNVKRVKEICNKIIEEKLDIHWSTTCRADGLANYDDDFIKLLKLSGVHILFVGSESGSEKILKKIDKHITVEDIIGMAHTTRKHKLRVHTSFMMGFPGETDEDRVKTYALMDKIKRIDPFIYITQICIYTPFPGTPMYGEIIKKGFKEPQTLEQWSDYTYFNCRLPWLSQKERVMLDNLAFITRFVFWEKEIKSRYLKFYFYPFYLFLRVDALIRWKFRFFLLAPEWIFFRKMLRVIH